MFRDYQYGRGAAKLILAKLFLVRRASETQCVTALPEGVAQISNLLYRRISFCQLSELRRGPRFVPSAD
jgi:hypothetical protein